MSPGKDETCVCGYIYIYIHIYTYIVVLYSLTRAILMSPGKDETRVCGYMGNYGILPKKGLRQFAEGLAKNKEGVDTSVHTMI